VLATRSPSERGYSVAVLLKVYAKRIDGRDEAAKRRIDRAVRFEDHEDAER